MEGVFARLFQPPVTTTNTSTSNSLFSSTSIGGDSSTSLKDETGLAGQLLG